MVGTNPTTAALEPRAARTWSRISPFVVITRMTSRAAEPGDARAATRESYSPPDARGSRVGGR